MRKYNMTTEELNVLKSIERNTTPRAPINRFPETFENISDAKIGELQKPKIVKVTKPKTLTPTEQAKNVRKPRAKPDHSIDSFKNKYQNEYDGRKNG